LETALIIRSSNPGKTGELAVMWALRAAGQDAPDQADRQIGNAAGDDAPDEP
jgi:hypothetical protein